jgi:hypothetical protein
MLYLTNPSVCCTLSLHLSIHIAVSSIRLQHSLYILARQKQQEHHKHKKKHKKHNQHKTIVNSTNLSIQRRTITTTFSYRLVPNVYLNLCERLLKVAALQQTTTMRRTSLKESQSETQNTNDNLQSETKMLIKCSRLKVEK